MPKKTVIRLNIGLINVKGYVIDGNGSGSDKKALNLRVVERFTIMLYFIRASGTIILSRIEA